MTARQKREKILAYKRNYAKKRRAQMATRTSRKVTNFESDAISKVESIVSEIKKIRAESRERLLKESALVNALKSLKF